DKIFPVTDGLSDAGEPVSDRKGNYLFFFASTNSGPLVNWFDQSNNDMRTTNSIYLLTLQKETTSPFAKESDEEEIKPDEKAKKEKKDSAVTDKKPESLKSESLKID